MDYKYRKDASHGSWSTMLLPLCLLSLVLKHGSGIYLLQFALCFTSCLLSLVTKERYTQAGKTYTYDKIFHAGFSLPLSLFLWYTSSYDIALYYIIFYAILRYCSYIVKNVLTNCPGSFTLGEVQVISQGVGIFLHCSVIVFLNKYNVFKNPSITQTIPESVSCLEIVLLGTILLVQILYMIPNLRQGVQFYITCLIVLFIMMLAWNLTLKTNILDWLISFCFKTKKRMFLICFWIGCTLASVVVVIMTNYNNTKASTITRKYFHLIINAIYIPGVIWDLELLRFASGIVLSSFILLEICRVLNIHIIGSVTGDAFQVFLDEKDSGTLILTHIYLLIGCSSPVWLSELSSDFHISHLSGVISVGFGDTAASIGGTLLGRTHWKGSKKTYEGSFCAFLVQLTVSLLILYLGHVFSVINILLVVVAVLLTTLLEAKTTQVDNLVLPLFMFSFMSCIH